MLDEDLPLTPAIFNQLDVDGSGKVDVEELKAIFGSSSSKDIEILMARVDLDGNKMLDYAEFERVMNMHQKMKDDLIGKASLAVRDALLRCCVSLSLSLSVSLSLTHCLSLSVYLSIYLSIYIPHACTHTHIHIFSGHVWLPILDANERAVKGQNQQPSRIKVLMCC